MSANEASTPPAADQHPPSFEDERHSARRDRDEARADRARAAAHLADAYRDDLTGALSRRPGRECLEREIARALAARASLTIAYADLDGLKRVNDQRGHAGGDRLLRQVGAALINNLRPYDLVIRDGGDEFICALIDSSREEAEQIMTRVLEEVERYDPLASLSVGYAELQRDDTLESLVERADKAMYFTRQSTRDDTSLPTDGRPRVSCLHCDERMNLQIETTIDTGSRSYTASCRTCRLGVRVSVPGRSSRFTGHENVDRTINLTDRT